MKKTKLLLLLACVSLGATAQQDFQGTIHYKTSQAKASEDSNMMITMRLAPNRILFTVNKENEEDVLILLDSLKIYLLNKNSRTYKTRKLFKMPEMNTRQKETIAGYQTTPQENKGGSSMGAFSILSQVWTADDLYYHIPAGLMANEFLMFFNNNRIVLKAVLGYADLTEDEPEDETDGHTTGNFNFNMELKAYEVLPGILPDSLFELPADYTYSNVSYFDTYDASMDTTTFDATPEVVEPPAPPPPAQNPVNTPAKTKTKTSSPARKND